MESTDTPKNSFEAALEKARAAEAAAQERFNRLSIVRLLLFAAMLASAWFWNQNGGLAAPVLIAILLAAFLFLMKKHQQVKRERDFQRNLQTINQDEIDRLSLRFTRTDTGQQFLEKEHAYLSDLDIFGEYSLYKLLNRTRTSEGARRLASWLKNHADAAEIRARQEAASQFRKYPERIQDWEATALLHENAAAQVNTFRAWATAAFPANLNRLLPWRWFPLVSAGAVVLAVLGLIPAWWIVFFLGIHFFILKQFQFAIEHTTNLTGTLGRTLVAYAELLEKAESATYECIWWRERREKITGASKLLYRVGNLFERLDYRNNPFFSFFVGIPTLWDVQCLVALENWKHRHHGDITNWLNVLADIEAMNSLAGHAFANPQCILPEIKTQAEVLIETTQMGHPLIPAAKRVSNSFRLDGTGTTILVTGSNMSGKSTFLRTIGLNLILAQMGAVVNAGSFQCTPVRVFSSMRTQDSLEESTSSFYAELKRLRQLLDLASEQDSVPVFYMLDEILKGTNSADRHRGAAALIRQLHSKNASGLVSTHDLELGQWGDTAKYVHNFHFRSDVLEGQLHFDYRLHEGICRSFNASELMRMMGIEIDA